MDRRKKILVNEYEKATDTALQEAAERSGARVFAKVRMADSVNIDKSGLSKQEFEYALKAHFDFVVTHSDCTTAFAVEFDGPSHDTDARVILRDSLKNSVCEKLNMPLLRIDKNLLERIGRFTLVGWLAEVWFLDEAFDEAQRRGDIPPDQQFMYFYIMGMGYVDNGRVVEVAPGEAFVEAVKSGKKVFNTMPYDPFIPYRSRTERYRKAGNCEGQMEIRATDPGGFSVAACLIKLTETDVIIGRARCRSFRFPPVGPSELARELAAVDASKKLKGHVERNLRPSPIGEACQLRSQFKKYGEYSEQGFLWLK